jgi:outer membrane protein assembly factor BamB
MNANLSKVPTLALLSVVGLVLLGMLLPPGQSAPKVRIAVAEDGTAATDSTASAANAAGKNWPMFRGNELATGVAQGRLPANLSLLWKFEVDGGAFEGTAAIVDGVVYLGDLDGKVYALGLADGKPKWEYAVDSGFPAPPAVRDGRLYIGDYDGRLHCLDIKNGRMLWTYQTGAEINSSVNFYKDYVIAGSQDSSLYCLKTKIENQEQKGELVWKHAIDDQIQCSPTVVDNRCFVAGCDAKLHIINLDNGEEVAAVEIDGPTNVTPAVLGDYVYFGTMGGMQYAVHWKEAETAWTFEEERRQEIRSSPAVTDSLVVFGSRGKMIYALDRKSGTEVWKFTARGRFDGSPVIVGDRAFIGASDGRIYGLNLKSGAMVWEYEAVGGFTASPAVADGRMVIASDRGAVYCFGAKE